jgi:hypothetical protein
MAQLALRQQGREADKGKAGQRTLVSSRKKYLKILKYMPYSPGIQTFPSSPNIFSPGLMGKNATVRKFVWQKSFQIPIAKLSRMWHPLTCKEDIWPVENRVLHTNRF